MIGRKFRWKTSLGEEDGTAGMICANTGCILKTITKVPVWDYPCVRELLSAMLHY